MKLLRPMLALALAVCTAHVVQACSTETELNPQPLPPKSDEPGAPSAGDNTGSSSSGGGGGTTSPAPADAAKEAGSDGGDAGTDAGEQ